MYKKKVSTYFSSKKNKILIPKCVFPVPCVLVSDTHFIVVVIIIAKDKWTLVHYFFSLLGTVFPPQFPNQWRGSTMKRPSLTIRTRTSESRGFLDYEKNRVLCPHPARSHQSRIRSLCKTWCTFPNGL